MKRLVNSPASDFVGCLAPEREINEVLRSSGLSSELRREFVTPTPARDILQVRLGASWGASSRRLSPGSVLEPLLAASWSLLERLGGASWAVLERLGPGGGLGASWSVLERLGASWALHWRALWTLQRARGARRARAPDPLARGARGLI